MWIHVHYVICALICLVHSRDDFRGFERRSDFRGFERRSNFEVPTEAGRQRVYHPFGQLQTHFGQSKPPKPSKSRLSTRLPYHFRREIQNARQYGRARERENEKRQFKVLFYFTQKEIVFIFSRPF